MKYDELDHFSHKHTLKLQCSEIPFTCDGCLEPGWGIRFRCEECNYDLHKDCALASPFTSHPFYKNCEFKFLPCAIENHFCDACGRDVHGFVYHCPKNEKRKKDLDLHPSCANLPLVWKGDGVKLRLHDKVSSECWECGSKDPKAGIRGWSYRSSCKKYHFHIGCVVDMFVKEWEKKHFAGVEIVQLENLKVIQSGASSGRERMNKYWRIAKLVLKMIVSVVIGDPVSEMTCLIGSLLSD